MSYERMNENEKQLREEVEKLLARGRTGLTRKKTPSKGKDGDKLPEELARLESRSKKITEAKAALEQEARGRSPCVMASPT
jgi:hypothetical protein